MFSLYPIHVWTLKKLLRIHLEIYENTMPYVEIDEETAKLIKKHNINVSEAIKSFKTQNHTLSASQKHAPSS